MLPWIYSQSFIHKQNKGLNIYLKDGTILPISQKRVVGFKDTLNDYIQRSN